MNTSDWLIHYDCEERKFCFLTFMLNLSLMSRTSESSSVLQSGMLTVKEIPVNVSVNYHSEIDVTTENKDVPTENKDVR